VRLIQEGEEQWQMQTFDSALFKMYQSGEITDQVALAFATSANDLKLRIQGLK